MNHYAFWSRFIAGRAARLVVLLAAVSVFLFWLVCHSPIDPVQAYVGADMLRVSPEQRQQIAARWGLYDPPPVRFARWAGALLQGDLGTSLIFRRPVAEVIKERFLASLALMGTAWLISGLLGFGLGVWAGYRRGSAVDRAVKWYCLTLAATPAFWLGLLLMMVFSVWLQLTPIGLAAPPGQLAAQVTFGQRLHHLLLPALTLSIVGVANIALHTRQKLLEVMESDYWLFALARGERGFALLRRHGLRNIALPAISLQFAQFSELFGGSILAEQIFSYPGLGQATVQAGLRGDVPLLLGIALFSALFVYAGNLAADIIYALVDPRLKAVRA
ncbi:ABC transporter permease [Desulfurispora thermophila]|uniref:ABC transporter permease n=1 Tax=Desulfurispora thermophila TaxID=265470 RepID=UPI0003660F90|nr:ABC transporter permease [Desulfurispora thermophila]